MPEASASVRLDNSDGAFTPFGGGTYEDFDWLSKLVWVQAKTGTNPASLTAQQPLFVGIVRDVRYEDDGFSSSVTIECDDLLSLIYNRAVLTSDFDNFLSPSDIRTLYNSIGINHLPALPAFGATTKNYATEGTSALSTYIPQEFSADTGTPAGDVLADLVVSEHGIVFTPYLAITTGATGTIDYTLPIIARNSLWGGDGDQDPTSLTVVETTPTGTQLPFKSPTVGFNIDELTNSSSCTIAGAGAVTQTANNTTSQASFGVRTADFTGLTYGFDADALELAEHLVERYDSVKYGVTGLTITGGMIQGKCADTALSTVSSLVTRSYIASSPDGLKGALFQPSFVDFTGAGGVDLSSRITFFRASYTITPDDWQVTLSDGRPAVSSFGFVLGQTNYGVLGTNKVA